jgi:hypothetical protein
MQQEPDTLTDWFRLGLSMGVAIPDVLRLNAGNDHQ